MSVTLVRGLNWLGDAVMSLPALSAIHKAAPLDDLVVLSGPATQAIYALAAGVKKVLVDQKGWRSRLKLLKTLKSLAPQKTILLQNAFGAAALAFLARLPERQGYARDARSFLLSRAIPIAPQSRLGHEVFYYLDLLKALGYEASYSTPRLAISDPKTPQPWPPGFRVAIAPGAAYGEAKRYPAQDFARVAQLLHKELPLSIVILGGTGEMAAAEEVAKRLEPDLKALNLAGRTSMSEALAVLNSCQLLIANDSGLAHVAGALGRPVVVLFGPTNPLATGPLAKKKLVLLDPADCAPCKNRVCPKKERICFLGLKPALVAEKILAFLKPKNQDGSPTLFWPIDQADWAEPNLSLPNLNIVKLPLASPEELRRIINQYKVDFNSAFWLSSRLDFLAFGQKLGGQTIMVVDPKNPQPFSQAYRLNPDLAAPDLSRGLEWIASQI
ncbi:MAG: lipopolysaccharide heptosyltransferase II [Deltaproteobacteria bacterium]|nr:lipopolysaccharide heptosyltransferase II [Deltaproteobacteria bacterium]